MSETSSAEPVLTDILQSNSEIVRALDFKTEIAMLCFILSIEAAHSLVDLSKLRETQPFTAIVLFATFIVAVVAYMLVLLPRQSPRLSARITDGHARTTVFFIPDPAKVTTEELVQAASSPQLARDLASEILKVSAIRNSKRRRFIVALFFTFAFYALLFFANIPF